MDMQAARRPESPRDRQTLIREQTGRAGEGCSGEGSDPEDAGWPRC